MDNLNLVVGVVGIAAVFIIWTGFQLIERLLSRQHDTIQEQAKTSLQDMFIFIDPTKLFYWNVAGLFIVPSVLWFMFQNPLVSVAAAVLFIVLPKMTINFMKKRRLQTFERQLPDALLMVAGSMQAGASLNVALESMVAEARPPISQEFELLLREQRMGVDFDTALKNMEARLPLQDFIMVISGMRISREVGGNLADILESLADTLRRKHTMEGKIVALTAQGKMQGLVMTGLPLFLLMALNFMEPEAMQPLFHTVMGWGVLAVVGVMLLLGYVFIRKITTIDV